MKKMLCSIVFAICSVLLSSSGAGAQTPSAVRVTADRTSVRDKAATDGAVVASVARGDQLSVVEVSGAWFKVRAANGREGFVHSLFVERVGDGTAPAATAAPPAPTMAPATVREPVSAQSTQTGGGAAAPRFAGDGSEPVGNRRFGVGLANIGPSVRYWMDAKKGFQVDGYFSSNFGYSVMAISPSFIMRFKQPTASGSVTFLPYWGGGATVYRFGDGYGDYYCRNFGDCGSGTAIGFGGFVGSEVAFESVPKLALSGNVGFYTSQFGYGGVGVGLGIHYYPGGRK